jgi:hypothetical protein
VLDVRRLVEANPVAAAVVDAVGWPVVGVAGVLAVAGAFAVLRRVRQEQHHLPPRTERDAGSTADPCRRDGSGRD